jgi:hypothetical protein
MCIPHDVICYTAGEKVAESGASTSRIKQVFHAARLRQLEIRAPRKLPNAPHFLTADFSVTREHSLIRRREHMIFAPLEDWPFSGAA